MTQEHISENIFIISKNPNKRTIFHVLSQFYVFLIVLGHFWPEFKATWLENASSS